MTDSDVLERAAALLRSAHDGKREGSGFTRARILHTLAERRRPRRGLWLVLAPLGTLLLVGSAWAQGTGSWPRVWQALASVLHIETPVSGASRGAPPAQPAPRARTPLLPTLRPEEPALPEAVLPRAVLPRAVLPEAAPAEVSSAAPAPIEPAAARAPVARTQTPLSTHRPSGKAARSAVEKTPAEQPLADPELSQFRSAHELHVQGQRRAAIDAYADYLRAYPHGRFVPEARYNTALDWIRLGDSAAARAALTPFAEGAYGGYRQQEARELIDALAGKQSPARH